MFKACLFHMSLHLLDFKHKDFISDDYPFYLLQLEDEERKEIEEQNPDVSQANRLRQMISSLPNLFNTIHLLFQSMNSSAITKEELVHKIIWINCDFVDRSKPLYKSN